MMLKRCLSRASLRNLLPVFGCNYAIKYVRDRPHLNVGVLGHRSHGKSTLTSAITKYLSKKGLAEFQDIDDLAKAPEERSKGFTINTATVEYQTEKMRFCHVDCPGHPDYGKNAVIGASRMETGILVVSSEGQDKQTKEHILIAKHNGVHSMVVYINKAELVKDKEMLDIVELEIRDLLTAYGYDGKNTFFVRGSALSALEGTNKELGEDSIARLLEVLDTKMPLPPRHPEKPFLLHVDHTIPISGRGCGVTGIIRSGKIKPDDDVEVVGISRGSFRTRVLSIETFDKAMSSAEAGDSVKMFVKNTAPNSLTRGQSISTPNKLAAMRSFEANAYVLLPEEGGRSHSFSNNFRPQFFIASADVAVSLTLPDNVEEAMPGTRVLLKGKLDKPLPFEKGSKFIIREAGKTVAVGEMTSVTIDDPREDMNKSQKKRKSGRVKG